ncbi:hypothetical protein [Cyanothece sp. BG0011]|uniref:hypothetical protein n=1 Tax=Cyanothece sp. BG0011 TaxID=2082950 RepID=UPI000D1FA3EC|nr:hypothetical protein [Cyanothece sp. BG0011]
MAKNLEHIMQNLSQERQKKIEVRTQELMIEEMTLRDIRKARKSPEKKLSLPSNGLRRLKND